MLVECWEYIYVFKINYYIITCSLRQYRFKSKKTNKKSENACSLYVLLDYLSVYRYVSHSFFAFQKTSEKYFDNG